MFAYVSRQRSQYVVRDLEERFIYFYLFIYLFIRVVLKTMVRTFLWSFLSGRNIY